VPKKLLRCIPLPVPMLLLLLFLSAWLFDKKKKKKALLTTCGVAVGSVVVVVAAAAAAADTLICLSMGFGGRTAISVAGVFFLKKVFWQSAVVVWQFLKRKGARDCQQFFEI
jgi:hypothetical protein